MVLLKKLMREDWVAVLQSWKWRKLGIRGLFEIENRSFHEFPRMLHLVFRVDCFVLKEWDRLKLCDYLLRLEQSLRLGLFWDQLQIANFFVWDTALCGVHSHNLLFLGGERLYYLAEAWPEHRDCLGWAFTQRGENIYFAGSDCHATLVLWLTERRWVLEVLQLIEHFRGCCCLPLRGRAFPSRGWGGLKVEEGK